MKKLIPVLLLVCFWHTGIYAQRPMHVNSDSIFSLLKIPPTYPYYLIAMPQEDCYKCRAPLYGIFKKIIEGKKDKHVAIITNNYVLANDFAKENNLACIVKPNKYYTNFLSYQSQTTLSVILKKDSLINYEIKKITNQFLDKYIGIKRPFMLPNDSVFSKNNFEVMPMKNGLVLFEEKTQHGLILGSDYTKYKKPTIDFKTLAQLPAIEGLDTNLYQTIAPKASVKIGEEFRIPTVHLHSMGFANDSLAYIFCTINLFYKSKVKDSSYVNFGTHYLALKKITDATGFEGLFDLSSYYQFLPLDTFSLGKRVFAPQYLYPIKINAKGIWTKMDELLIKEGSMKFFGLSRLTVANTNVIASQLDSSIGLGDNVYLYENGRAITLFTIKNDSASTTPFTVVGNHIYLNYNQGFNYIHAIKKAGKNQYTCTYTKADDGIYNCTLDISKKTVSNIKRNDINYYPAFIYWQGKRLMAVSKQMRDEDYSVGDVVVEQIN